MRPSEPFLTADAVAEIEAGLKALGATGGSEQVHRLVVPSLPVSQRADGRSGQTAGRVAGRHDPPRRRRRRPLAGQYRGGDHHAGRAARRGRLLGRRRGADPGRLPIHAFRSGKTAPKDDGLHKITVLSTSERRQEAERARCGRRDRGGHRPRSGQHSPESPVSRRIRQARKGFGRIGRPRGGGARRQSADRRPATAG